MNDKSSESDELLVLYDGLHTKKLSDFAKMIQLQPTQLNFDDATRKLLDKEFTASISNPDPTELIYQLASSLTTEVRIKTERIE